MANGKPIEIDFVSNERPFLKGAGNVEDSLEKIGTSLDHLADDSSRSTGKIGDDLKDAAREGDRQLEKLESSFREMADTATRESRAAGDATSHEIKRGTEEAGEGVRTLKDESRQNAEEIASSFDGSAQSIADGFQSIAATALSGFGPAGAIAGLAAAAGIGLASTAIAGADTQSEAFREHVKDLAGQFIETGGTGKRSLEQITEQLQALAVAGDDEANLGKLSAAATALRVPFAQLTKAYLEGGAPLDALIAKNKHLIDAENRRLNAATAATGEAAAAYSPELKALEDRQQLLEEQRKAIEQAKVAEKEWHDAGGAQLEEKAQRESDYIDQLEADAEREKSAAQDAADVHTAALASINDAYDSAAGAASSYVDAESGLFDTKKYILAMQEKQKALEEYQKNLAESPLTAEAKTFLESQGADSAATFLAGYKKATPAQQAELNRIWTEAGKSNSATYSSNLQSSMPATVAGPRVVLSQSGVDELETRLGSLARKKYEIEIGVRYPNGKPVLQ